MSTSRSFFSSVFVPSFNRLTRAALLLVGFACALAAAGLTARAADIHVPAGGDFQSALHSAQPGDTILLQAGATYVGPFTLPKKVGDAWITVRTSAPDSQLPAPGVRATPASSAVMPKLVTPGMNLPALSTAAGAHHYRFVGVEFKPANAAAIVNTLVELGKSGAEQTTLAEVPHHLVFDRCYIHGDPAGTLVRGVALNSAHTDIVNSYISDAKMVGRDTQAICGWNGPGPFKIVNNYLEGAGENVMFGGADSSAASLIPSDIEIRRNHFYKPTSWRGVWTVKNLFELKSARRVVIDGNLFENNWHGAQSGYAILFTVRNQGGTAPWSTVEDVQFTNNVVRHSGGGVNILGKDDLQASQQVARVTIKNNLFEDIDGLNWGGQGNFLIITEARDVTVEHNTVLHGGNITTAYGAASTGFVFRNNLMGHNDYGLFGDAVGYGFPTLNQYFPGAAFERNVIAGAPDWRYPANNFYPASLNDAGFVNRAVGDYRLSAASPYRNAGTDGKDLGCDFDALHAAQSGQPAATPTPTPTPTPAPTATPTPTPAPTATPTPTPTATPTPTPTPAPTPTPTSGGKSREALGRTKKNAQTVSNQLAAAQSSAPPSGPTANVAESTTPQIASIVSELELAYAEFQLDRGLYAPAARIESALVAALEHARAAAASAQQSQLAEVKVKLRRSIDSLELADALMTYGDIQNPIDTPEYFVRQHYVDFLDREPDAAGLSYWVAQITSCGGAPACVEARRINVSAAFFLSIEFQKTGYLVHRVYQAAYGRTPLRAEFGAEAEDVAGGVIVGTPGWESILEANTRDYFDRLARRDDFKARYDALTNEQFVAALLANGGVTLPGNERDALLQELNATGSRAVALRRVVESDALTRKEKNPAFVEMQYFGYMRRDFDPAGFQFWLQKLVNHSGDHVSAQMVKSFLDSGEYRGRFPQR